MLCRLLADNGAPSGPVLPEDVHTTEVDTSPSEITKPKVQNETIASGDTR